MKRACHESRIQAEIGGGSIVSPHELPRKGQYLREFQLTSSHGSTISLSAYRGHSALVLILSDARRETERLMRDFAGHYENLKKNDAEVLAIVQGSRVQALALERRLGIPYPVLLDENGRIHRELGATDAQNVDAAAVWVTDRFREVFALYRTAEGTDLPGIEEILRNLEFIGFQCPECEPPEWPV